MQYQGIRIDHGIGIASSDRGMAFKGGLAAFDLAQQALEWTHIHPEETGAGVAIWGGPSIDLAGNVAFAGSGNNYTRIDTDISSCLPHLNHRNDVFPTTGCDT